MIFFLRCWNKIDQQRIELAKRIAPVFSYLHLERLRSGTLRNIWKESIEPRRKNVQKKKLKDWMGEMVGSTSQCSRAPAM